MQKAFDELYQQSKNGNNFYKLLEIIGSEQNICLAYRNLKTNSGSKTAGTDGKTIEDIKGLSDREVIETVRKQLADYHPQSVRRVFIPKPGSDKKRPLGIPCIWDRLIQQCILQVLGIKKETKIITVGKMPLLPLTGVHHKHPINFSQDITSYTAKGREKIHKSVQCVETQELRNVMKYRNPNESIEFNDNSISAYLVQQGNCYVMGNRLNVHQMKCIRKIPVGEGGTDKHTNIAFISEEVWRAVMTEDISETIRIMKKFNMDDKQRRRFNRLRENYGLLPIKKR